MRSLQKRLTATVADVPGMHHAEFEARFAECARYLSCRSAGPSIEDAFTGQ